MKTASSGESLSFTVFYFIHSKWRNHSRWRDGETSLGDEIRASEIQPIPETPPSSAVLSWHFRVCAAISPAPRLSSLQLVSERCPATDFDRHTPVQHPPTPWSLLKHASEIAQSWQARGPSSGQASHRLGVSVAWTRGRPQLTGRAVAGLAGGHHPAPLARG
jgi:hypothetical protein